MPGNGVKYDTGKRQWSLLPWRGAEEVVRVLEFGADKYTPDNWRRVASERYLDAAFRHLIAHARGEYEDTESGLPHLAHATSCLLFMLELRSEIGDDNG